VSPTMNGQQQQTMSINQLQDFALNMVYNITSIVCLPLEMGLRPNYGSRYISPIVQFFSTGLMLFLPLLFGFANIVTHMVPFANFRGPTGLIGIGGISRLFFLGTFIHGLRIWKRMIHMELEENSLYEGPPLFFFRKLPLSFWVIRIVIEPGFLFIHSIILPNVFILEPSAAHFLSLSAICLAMKQYIAWYMQWQFIRGLLDSRHAGPIIAKVVEGRATQDELARVHLASFPKNLPDDIRRAAAIHIAHAYSSETKLPELPSNTQQ
jgi:hypothetical protein